MRQPRALDLFCCAGGASMGLHRAGFEVVGVDINPQPRYPFEFVQGDALEYPIDGFDLVWASPPCQAFTAYKRRGHVRPSPNLIPQTREKLSEAPVSIIENVPGAPLFDPIVLCGSMFGLNVRRHRLFECSFAALAPLCNHDVWKVRKYPGATNRTNRRFTCEVGVRRIPLAEQIDAMDRGPIDVSGTGGPRRNGRLSRCRKPENITEARKAMRIDWMTREELSQAIPPAYAQWLGERAIRSAMS